MSPWGWPLMAAERAAVLTAVMAAVLAAVAAVMAAVLAAVLAAALAAVLTAVHGRCASVLLSAANFIDRQAGAHTGLTRCDCVSATNRDYNFDHAHAIMRAFEIPI